MRSVKSVLLLLALIASVTAAAQKRTIRGKVVDAKTLEPLPFASIFINFTTAGTNADEKGEFVLKNIPEGEQELICSYVGHESYQVKLSKVVDREFVEIKLKPLPLKEVEVTSKKDEVWADQLKKFEARFLGTGKGVKCRIVNPYVLDFKEGTDGIFSASASEPLVIENHTLGYRVTYTLKIFMVNEEAFNITGNVRFEEILTEDKTLASRWHQNRLKAYNGSSRHLFKSILDNTLEQDGFRVYVDQTAPGPLVRSPNFKDDLHLKIVPFETANKVVKDKAAPVYRIILPQRLEVHYRKQNSTETVYRDISHAVSWVEVVGGFVETTPQGVIQTQSRMVLSGYMAKARVAELLPYDYEPEKAPTASRPSLEMHAEISKVEKAYVQTDKPYYYPDEILWLKVYMNYGDREKMDSLSRVLYVDLVGNGKVIQHKIFPIENGMVSGEITVPRLIEPGDYYLRAYTNWMRNFGSEYIFSRPLKVLSSIESIFNDQENPFTSSKGITVSPNRERYGVKDRIQLKVSVKDSLGNPIDANVSVSVTDVLQVTPVRDEKTILESFPIQTPARKDLRRQYEVEYGLCFKGQFLNHRGKREQAALTIVEGEFENVMSATTNEQGEFVLEHLHFNDSAKLAIQGKTLNKKTGTVLLQDIAPLPVTEVVAGPLKVKVTTGSSSQRYRVMNVEDTAAAQLLPEITLDSKRMEQQSNRFEEKKTLSKHGTPDVTIDGEWLRSQHATNLLYAIQSRVAGFRVVASNNGGGEIKYSINIGPSSTFMSSATTAPLLLINDMPIMLEGTELAGYIQTINVQEVDRIEVLKYGKGAAYGTRGGNGVIAIYLRTALDERDNGPRSKTFDTKNFQTFTLTGYSATKEFKSPDYAEINAEASPDFRSTVYWNPNLTTDENGLAQLSFYAADLPTTYRVVIEGVTASGEPVRGETLLEIVDK
jgi:hypothetical protein